MDKGLGRRRWLKSVVHSEAKHVPRAELDELARRERGGA